MNRILKMKPYVYDTHSMKYSTMTLPRVLIFFSLLTVGASIFLFLHSSRRTEILKTLLNQGVVTEAIVTERALTHGSGPKPQPDFGYTYHVNGIAYSGTIMGRGAFKLSPTLFSVNYLDKKPVIGEGIPITYLPQDPSVSAPFQITEKKLSSCRLSGLILSGSSFILGLSLFMLVRGIKLIKGVHV